MLPGRIADGWVIDSGLLDLSADTTGIMKSDFTKTDEGEANVKGKGEGRRKQTFQDHHFCRKRSDVAQTYFTFFYRTRELQKIFLLTFQPRVPILNQ